MSGKYLFFGGREASALVLTHRCFEIASGTFRHYSLPGPAPLLLRFYSFEIQLNLLALLIPYD